MSAIIEKLHIPWELTVQFLGTFARFEYALKRSGYVKGNDRFIEADWDRLAHEMTTLAPDVLAPILASGRYLQAHPPKKQVLQDGKLVWKVRGTSGGSAIQETLLNVRTVRNNVFHGGKFPEGPVAEPLRDEKLIQDCLAILCSLLKSQATPADIPYHFWSGD